MSSEQEKNVAASVIDRHLSPALPQREHYKKALAIIII